MEKAIENWKIILSEEPDNEWARGELKSLYLKAEKWNALVCMLKEDADAVPEDDAAEKIEILNKIIEIYETRLSMGLQVTKPYYQAIYKLTPENQEVQTVLIGIYREERRWKDLIAILEDKADATADKAQKIELLYEIADLCIERLSSKERADGVIEKILALNPQDARAREAVKEKHKRQRNWDAYAQILEEEAKNADNDDKPEYLSELAKLYTERLSERSRAIDIYWELLELSPDITEPLNALERLTTVEKDWAGLLKVLDQRIELAERQDEQVSLLTKQASICKDRLHDPLRATAYWSRILQIKPGYTRAANALRDSYVVCENWDALEQMYSSKNNLKGLVDIFAAALKKADNPDIVKDLSLRCAKLYEGPLDKPDRAIPHYEQILSLEPGNEQALRRLMPIYKSLEHWPQLLEMIGSMSDSSLLGELFEGDENGLLSLEMAAREAGHSRVLVHILECSRNRLMQGDLDEWRAVTLETVQVFRGELQEKAAGLRLLGEVIEKFPSDRETLSLIEDYLGDDEYAHEAATILEPYLGRTNDIKILSRTLQLLSQSTKDPERRCEYQLQLADIYEEKIGDPKAAFGVLTVVLGEHPGKTSLWNRITLLAERSNLERELVDCLGGVYKSGKLDERAEVALAFRLVEFLDTRLGCPADAEIYHMRLLRENPGQTISFLSLERLYKSKKRWADLIDLYDTALKSESDNKKRMALLKKTSAACLKLPGGTQKTIATHLAMLEVEPTNQEAQQTLARLYRETEQWKDLFALLSSSLKLQGDEAPADTLFELGQLAQQHLKQTAVALECYQKVLERNPEHQGARNGLEDMLEIPELQPAAAKALFPLYEHRKDYAQMANLLLMEQEDKTLSTEQRIAVLTRLANIREQHLQDAEGAFESFALAFSLDPTNLSIRNEAARLAKLCDNTQGYVQLLGKTIAGHGKNIPLTAQLLAEMARVYEQDLGDMDRADLVNRKLYNLAPTDTRIASHALNALDRIVSKRGDWPGLLQLLKLQTKLKEKPSEAVELLLRICDLEETKLNRTADALATLKEILAIDRKNVEALDRLERLLEREKKWMELIDILQARVDVETSPKAKRDLFRRIASLASKM